MHWKGSDTEDRGTTRSFPAGQPIQPKPVRHTLPTLAEKSTVELGVSVTVVCVCVMSVCVCVCVRVFQWHRLANARVHVCV